MHLTSLLRAEATLQASCAESLGESADTHPPERSGRFAAQATGFSRARSCVESRYAGMRHRRSP